MSEITLLAEVTAFLRQPHGQFIAGHREAGHGAPFAVINPATGEAIAEITAADVGQADRVMESARQAFNQWREMPTLARGALLLKSEGVHKVNISLQSFEGNGGDEPEDYLRACADFAAAAGESGKLCVLRLWNSGGFETLNPRIRAELARRFPRPWEEFRRSLRLAPRVFLESGDMFDWPDMSAAELGESCFCYGLRDQVGVLCDGTVVPCCLDHDGDVPLGNLFERELDEILACRAPYRYARASRAGVPSRSCAGAAATQGDSDNDRL